MDLERGIATFPHNFKECRTMKVVRRKKNWKTLASGSQEWWPLFCFKGPHFWKVGARWVPHSKSLDPPQSIPCFLPLTTKVQLTMIIVCVSITIFKHAIGHIGKSPLGTPFHPPPLQGFFYLPSSDCCIPLLYMHSLFISVYLFMSEKQQNNV